MRRLASVLAAMIAIGFAAAACTEFGVATSNVAANDDGGGVIDSATEADASSPSVPPSKSPYACDAATPYVFCADFDDGTLQPFTTADEVMSATGEINVLANPGNVAGNSLHIKRLAASPATFLGMKRPLDPADDNIRVEIELYIDASLTGEVTRYGILSVVSDDTHGIHVYVLEDNGIMLYSQFTSMQYPSTLSEAQKVPIPIRQWATLRLDVSLTTLGATLSIGKRGDDLAVVAAVPPSAALAPTKPAFAVGPEHFAPQGTVPDLSLYVDRFAITQ